MPGFEDLVVWRRAVALSVEVYRETASLKDFGFRDQITRSSLSIPSNIAEGMERPSRCDQRRFLNYARGSCGELRTQAIVGTQAGLIPPTTAQTWIRETREISAMIGGLMRAIGE